MFVRKKGLKNVHDQQLTTNVESGPFTIMGTQLSAFTWLIGKSSFRVPLDPGLSIIIEVRLDSYKIGHIHKYVNNT